MQSRGGKTQWTVKRIYSVVKKKAEISLEIGVVEMP